MSVVIIIQLIDITNEQAHDDDFLQYNDDIIIICHCQ